MYGESVLTTSAVYPFFSRLARKIRPGCYCLQPWFALSLKKKRKINWRSNVRSCFGRKSCSIIGHFHAPVHSGFKRREPAKFKFTWCDITSFFKQVPSNSLNRRFWSLHCIRFTFKGCQTVAGISITSQFHDFFESHIWFFCYVAQLCSGGATPATAGAAAAGMTAAGCMMCELHACNSNVAEIVDSQNLPRFFKVVLTTIMYLIIVGIFPLIWMFSSW